MTLSRISDIGIFYHIRWVHAVCRDSYVAYFIGTPRVTSVQPKHHVRHAYGPPADWLDEDFCTARDVDEPCGLNLWVARRGSRIGRAMIKQIGSLV